MDDETLAPCAADSFVRPDIGRWLHEPEGDAVPAGLEVIDAHVHLFPARVFEAVWRWFDKHAWEIRYKLHTEQVIEFLRVRGVSKFIALHYSHKPGMAAVLNQYCADAARENAMVIPFATVLPGEPDMKEVLRDAFGRLGLRGVKLHCHVQQMAADDPRMDEVYAECELAGRPVVIHSGREPALVGYGIDTRKLCGADQIDRVLKKHPKLKLVVPHLGADEFEAYEALLDVHENLYLDTTMAISEAFIKYPGASLFPGRASRLLYGTDFPAIPYAWDRELRKVLSEKLSPADQHAIFAGNAKKLFD